VAFRGCREPARGRFKNCAIACVAYPGRDVEDLLRYGADSELGVAFWVGRVREAFAWKPLSVKLGPTKGLRTMLRELLQHVERRGRRGPSGSGLETVLQHLAAATLDCTLAARASRCNSCSPSATQRRGAGLFLGDVAIHVTASPSEALIERCRQNMSEGLRPVVLTLPKGVNVAEALAESKQLGNRIDIFDIEQFVALNVYKLGKFTADGRNTAVDDIVKRYNEIVEEVETDPSLKIELRQ